MKVFFANVIIHRKKSNHKKIKYLFIKKIAKMMIFDNNKNNYLRKFLLKTIKTKIYVDLKSII